MQVLFRCYKHFLQDPGVKPAKWGTPFATYRNSYRNWYRKTWENQRKASIFANSFCLVSMLEWA